MTMMRRISIHTGAFITVSSPLLSLAICSYLSLFSLCQKGESAYSFAAINHVALACTKLTVLDIVVGCKSSR